MPGSAVGPANVTGFALHLPVIQLHLRLIWLHLTRILGDVAVKDLDDLVAGLLQADAQGL